MKRIFLSVLVLGIVSFGISFLFLSSAAAGENQDLTAEFTALLPDLASSDLEKLEKAQQKLQDLCFAAGAPGSEADQEELNRLMVEQLSQPIEPISKTWILFQLGRTGTDSEVEAISVLLHDSDIRVRQQALRSLALIKTDKAVDALKKEAESVPEEFKTEIEETLKSVSGDYVIPIETEWPLCLPYVDDEAVEKWMAGYEDFDVTTKARTLASLAVRGDRKYRSYAVEASLSPDPDLKRDGILALEKLGTVEDISLLLENARIPEWERIALLSADRIEYPGFDDVLLERLKAEDDLEDFSNLVKILVARHQFAAVPLIMDGAQRWPERRSWLLGYTETLLRKEDLPRFIQLMLTVRAPADRENLEKVIMRIADGNADLVISLMTDENRIALAPLLGRIDDPSGFAILTEMLQSKDKTERESAVKGFCNAPNAKYADTLLVIAKNSEISGAGRIAAFRAYVRVISLPEDEIGIEISDQEKLAALQKAFEAASRDQDKNLVLDRVKSIRIPESLVFVLPYFDDPKFSETAAATLLELSHHDFLRKMDPEAFKGALDKIIEKGKNPAQVDEARRYREAIK